jgi:hypothetical protein
MAKKNRAAFALSLVLGLVFVILGIFLGKDIGTLVVLGVPAASCFIVAVWKSPWVTQKRKVKAAWLGRGITGTALVIVLFLVAGRALWTYANDLPWRPHGPFSVSPGVSICSVWSSTNINTGFYWLVHDYVHRMTPTNVVAFYTVTNLKSTPSMISNLYLEILGVGGDWYELSKVDPHTGWLVAATLDKPTDVTEITLSAGLLLDKLQNRSLAPGEAVQGWMLYQYPPVYIAPANSDLRMRMVVVDTANNKVIVPLAWPSSKGEVLGSEMQGHKINIDLRNYQIFQYGSQPSQFPQSFYRVT